MLKEQLGEFNSLLDVVQKLKDNGSITKYQHKGMLLEIATLYALVELGIRPIPLHNPFDDDYTRDQHLSIDMIFRYKNLTFGVECKNLNRRWDWNQKDFVKRQLLDRFDYVRKVVPINVKVLVTSYVPLGGSVIPSDYYQLILNKETTVDNIYENKILLTQLFTNLFNTITKLFPENLKINSFPLNNSKYTVNTTHGHKNLYENIIMIKKNAVILKRIDNRLKKKFQIEGWKDE